MNQWFDIDFYKLTMLQFIWKHYADVPVTFRLHSRKQRLDAILQGFDADYFIKKYFYNFYGEEFNFFTSLDIAYLSRLGYFEDQFLRDLSNMFSSTLARPKFTAKSIEVSGDWFSTSLWETIILSAVSEHYSLRNIQPPDPFLRGHDICEVSEVNAIWFDFGTRRRWSFEDHEALIADLSIYGEDKGFRGTSNVRLARLYDVQPVGTYAHELEMAIRPFFKSNFDATRDVLSKWGAMYPRKLRIALTDTYTTPDFLNNHGKYLINNNWRGVRLDSGDPFDVAYRVRKFLQKLDAREKWDIIFSDSLKAKLIGRLQYVYHHNVDVDTYFGWGTSLTNPNSDLSLVMKAVASNGIETFKLTDDEAKSIR